MPAKSSLPGSPQQWLRHARSDLALAEAHKTRYLLFEHLCFHAQQAAEKAVKAVLVHQGRSVQKTHDLGFLMQQLSAKTPVPVTLIELPLLNRYAVQFRYPGEPLPVTARDRRKAVRLARHAIDWAEQLIN